LLARGAARFDTLLVTCALAACSPEDDPNYQMPIAPVGAGDAQVVVMTPPVVPMGNDAGVVVPRPTMDAQVPIVMGPDAQLPFDAMWPAMVGAEGGIGIPDGGAPDALVVDAGPPRMDLGKGTGKDVITIGDSWMELIFEGIQDSLVSASGQPYRTYGVPGTRLLSGEIPGQYTSAKRADANIKTVVMTAGGNDIIQDSAIEADCQTGGDLCKMQLDKIGKALTDLWAQMSKDGVMDVVHIMYSSSAGNPLKDREANNKALADACAAVPLPMRCHLLNTDTLIQKADIRSDGIHPTSAGYDKIGKAVFELMVKEGMRR
jgi:lysophospholipase L1-like esterase